MRVYLTILSLLLVSFGFSQEIKQRLIVFGDAGEINSKQSFLISNAQGLTLANKTKAFFIGDNSSTGIYT